MHNFNPDTNHELQTLAITKKQDLMGEPLSKQRRKRYRQRQRQKAKIQKAKMAEQGGVTQEIIIPGQEVVTQDVFSSVEGANENKYRPTFLPEPLIPRTCEYKSYNVTYFALLALRADITAGSENGRKLAVFANVLRSIYQRRDCVDVEINILGAQLAALEVRLNAVQKEERDLFGLYLREFSEEARYLCRAPSEPASDK
ncbi:uncharacterized protein N7503_001458 [Penicillium pulvis]|uniref:uncharacterized protein n=1 Tax=Penicillium pulvis TaxID=1562058 RepID=UPI002548766C|nr:uncharacterized protein N7503_001458 [Penicillium pulvis]KAJ5809240.1 hypothetical protein N7503_001458 [Penicillium pulvis]